MTGVTAGALIGTGAGAITVYMNKTPSDSTPNGSSTSNLTAAERAKRAKQLQQGIDNIDSLIGTDALPSLKAELAALSKKLRLQRELNKLFDLPVDHNTGKLIEQIDALLPYL